MEDDIVGLETSNFPLVFGVDIRQNRVLALQGNQLAALSTTPLSRESYRWNLPG